MPESYSQPRALRAITRASFTAIFSNPSAIIFSILFPIIFIMIFGAFGNGGATVYRVALAEGADTTNAFYQYLTAGKIIRIASYPDTAALRKDLIRGRLTAVLDIQVSRDSSGKPSYRVSSRSTSASSNTLYGFNQSLEYAKLKFESAAHKQEDEQVHITRPEIEEVRQYRQIDFILPGQLGFSILFSTLFGVALTFYNLREQLVLKRFYASPVNRINILLGIGMSRLFFQLLSVSILIGVGHFFLNFTLQNGLITYLEMLLVTVIMLFLLMGVGLIISSVARTDANIPLIINLFGFPQMLLSGTFFPIDVFPVWLQKICYFLPLTQFNDAIRKISFEGLHIYDCGEQLLVMGVWIAVIYTLAVRFLKWE